MQRLKFSYPAGLTLQDQLPLSQASEPLPVISPNKFASEVFGGRTDCQIDAGEGNTANRLPEAMISQTLSGDQICKIWNELPEKLWVQGCNKPPEEYGTGVAARVYVAVRPECAHEAFCSICQALHKNQALPMIDMCLVYWAMVRQHVQNKTIVIYVGNTEVSSLMDSVMDAIAQAKEEHPRLFQLSPAEYDVLLAERLSSYRMEVDNNITVVEQLVAEVQPSWDHTDRPILDYMIGYPLSKQGVDLLEIAEKKLELLQDRRDEVLYEPASVALKSAIDSGEYKVPDGETITLQRTRNLGCPALITRVVETWTKQDSQLILTQTTSVH